MTPQLGDLEPLLKLCTFQTQVMCASSVLELSVFCVQRVLLFQEIYRLISEFCDLSNGMISLVF